MYVYCVRRIVGIPWMGLCLRNTFESWHLGCGVCSWICPVNVIHSYCRQHVLHTRLCESILHGTFDHKNHGAGGWILHDARSGIIRLKMLLPCRFEFCGLTFFCGFALIIDPFLLWPGFGECHWVFGCCSRVFFSFAFLRWPFHVRLQRTFFTADVARVTNCSYLNFFC